jgi:DNA recombination protein RmuC
MILNEILVSAILFPLGLALGWFFGARPVTELRRREREAADALVRAEEQRNAALRDIAEEQRRAGEVRAELSLLREDRDAARTRLAALEAESQAREQGFEAQLRALTEAKEQLSAQFSEIGGKLLGEAQRAFLERADQRLSQQHERSEAQLKALLHPVGEQIKSYDTRIGEIERARTEAYGELKGLMDSMRVGQERVQAEAQRLVLGKRRRPT